MGPKTLFSLLRSPLYCIASSRLISDLTCCGVELSRAVPVTTHARGRAPSSTSCHPRIWTQLLLVAVFVVPLPLRLLQQVLRLLLLYHDYTDPHNRDNNKYVRNGYGNGTDSSNKNNNNNNSSSKSTVILLLLLLLLRRLQLALLLQCRSHCCCGLCETTATSHLEFKTQCWDASF